MLVSPGHLLGEGRTVVNEQIHEIVVRVAPAYVPKIDDAGHRAIVDEYVIPLRSAWSTAGLKRKLSGEPRYVANTFNRAQAAVRDSFGAISRSARARYSS